MRGWIGNRWNVGILLLVLAGVGGAVWMCARPGAGDDRLSSPEQVLISRRQIRQAEAKARQARLRKAKKAPDVKRVHVDLKEKPIVSTAELEDERLTTLEREVLRQLQVALDNNDFSAVLAIVRRVQAEYRGDAGHERFSSLLKRKLIAALGWVGSDGMAELVGFLADPDATVVQDAQSTLEQALDDLKLSDMELSQVIVQLSQIVTDANTLEWYFNYIPGKMRNSVGIQTIVDVNAMGTPEAQGKVLDILEFFTGTEGIDTIEKAEQWLAENPDSEEDPYIYGAVERPQDPDMEWRVVPGWKPPAQ